MSIQEDVRYLLDRVEIQDKVSLYGLEQDLHQADNPNRDILEQWNDLVTPDARIPSEVLRPRSASKASLRLKQQGQ